MKIPMSIKIMFASILFYCLSLGVNELSSRYACNIKGYKKACKRTIKRLRWKICHNKKAIKKSRARIEDMLEDLEEMHLELHETEKFDLLSLDQVFGTKSSLEVLDYLMTSSHESGLFIRETEVNSSLLGEYKLLVIVVEGQGDFLKLGSWVQNLKKLNGAFVLTGLEYSRAEEEHPGKPRPFTAQLEFLMHNKGKSILGQS